MRAERIYTCRGIASYIVLTDDGEYRTTTPALTRLGGAIMQDYIPRRIGRGAEDITDTPDGRVILGTLNGNLSSSSASEKRRAAAMKSWECRSPTYQRDRTITVHHAAWDALNEKRGDLTWTRFLCDLAGIEAPPDGRRRKK